MRAQSNQQCAVHALCVGCNEQRVLTFSHPHLPSLTLTHLRCSRSRRTFDGAHDVVAAAVVFAMGLTSGWVASSCMVTAPPLACAVRD